MYLSGETEHSILGLGGSAHHLLGAPPPDPQLGYSRQLTHVMLSIQAKFGDNDSREKTKDNEGHNDLRYVAMMAEESLGRTKNPERFDFLAKRLLYDPAFKEHSGKVQRVLLGSPLYVAKAD